MSDASVRLVFTGNSAQAQAAVRGLEGSFSRLDRVAARLGRGLVTGLKVGTVAAVAGLTYAAVKASSFESQLNTLGAVTGKMGRQLQQASALAKRLGNDLTLPATSADDAARAMTELAKGGLTLKEAMAAAKGTLQLAAAAEVDVGVAAEITADALNAFGLEGEQAVHVADLLANAANKSTGEITDFGIALSQAALVAVQANQTIDTTVTALAALANQGLKGSDAGTSLRTMWLRLMAPTKKAAEVIGDLNVRLRDQQGNMLPLPRIIENFRSATQGLDRAQRDAALSTIFGADAIRAINALLKVSPKEWARLERAITKSGGAQDLANAKMKGFRGALEGLKSAVETLAITLGEPIIRGLTPAVRKLSEFVQWADRIVNLGRRKGVTFAIKVAWEDAKGFFDKLLFGKKAETTIQAKLEFVDPEGADFISEGLVQKVQRALGQIDWGAVWDRIVDGARGGAELLGDAWEFLQSQDWFGLGTKIGQGAIDFIKGAVSGLFDPDDGTGLGSREGLGAALGPAGGVPAFGVVQGIGDELLRSIPAVGPYLADAVKWTREWLNPLSLIGKLWDAIEGDASAAVAPVRASAGAIRQLGPAADAVAGHVSTAIRSIAPSFADVSAKAGEMGAQVAAGISLVPPAARKIAPAFAEIGAAIQNGLGKAPAAIRQVAPSLAEISRAADQLGRKKPRLQVTADTTKARTELQTTRDAAERLDKTKINPKARMDTSAADSAAKSLSAKLRTLDSTVAQPIVQVIDRASGTIAQVYQQLRALNGQVATAYIRTVRTEVSRRAAGGFVGMAQGGWLPGSWSESAPDSVPVLAKPGELFLTLAQQMRLGGPKAIAEQVGLPLPSWAATESAMLHGFATGGFVSAARKRGGTRKHGTGYKAKSREVAQLQKRLDANRDRQDRLDRSIQQDDTEFSISVEEFILVDNDGNESLDTGAVAKRVGEIDKLIGRYQELLGLVDEETAILNALIAALEAAVNAYQAEIRDQQRIVREMTDAIRDATQKMNATDDAGAKASYQSLITGYEGRRSKAQSKIGELQGRLSELRGDLPGTRRDKADQPLDRRDVDLQIMSLNQEKSEVLAIRPRPAEPTSAGAEADAAAAGADLAGDTGPSEREQFEQRELEALVEQLKRRVAELALALGIQNAQLPIIGAYAAGTLHVPTTGLALVHAGEQITPAGVATTRRAGARINSDDVTVVVEIADGMRWLERFIDIRVERGAGRLSERLGRDADTRLRDGRIGRPMLAVR